MLTRQISVTAVQAGLPTEESFQIKEVPLPPVGPGQVLVRNQYLSVDPWHMGQLGHPGRLIPGDAVGEVIESKHPSFAPGDHVQGFMGWQTFAVADGSSLRKVDPKTKPLSAALGLLGLTGLTAYFGLLEVGRPRAGETVLISGAAGAVGNVVGQIAKLLGCRVVGIAGSDEKVDWLVGELGFDAAFNYKRTDDYIGKVKELCPNGVDVFFDNVGGALFDAALRSLNRKGRIVICGQISEYHLDEAPLGPRLMGLLISKQARIEGFQCFEFADRFGEAIVQLSEWAGEGRLRFEETVVVGFEQTPRAFVAMMKGQNQGKQVVKL